ncbi:MAG: hypothetical protein NTU49_06130 [Gammaproteobacteria bacterium]|nr:hypothetical protein [Gammaproteobacteria bacterium]
MHNFFGFLRPETQNKLMVYATQEAFKDIESLTTEGLSHIKPGKTADPSEAMISFSRAASIAKSLAREIPVKKDKECKIIANAYACHADAIYKFKPEKIDDAIYFVNEALKLDPKNQIALNLKLSVNIYYDIPMI